MNLMKHLVFAIFQIASCIFLISCSDVGNTESALPLNHSVTFWKDSFLKGNVASVVYYDEDECDSTSFVYDNRGRICKTIFFLNGEHDGFCEYYNMGLNRIDLHYFNNDKKETSYDIVEFDDNKNITLYRNYGFIFPDTTKMVLLYMKQNSYDKENRMDVAFEYFCDGIPPYKYRYTYDKDGREIEECFLAVTGDIYTITKVKKDKMGNIVEISENMSYDSADWYTALIKYKYDEYGNWIERLVMPLDPMSSYSHMHTRRRIHYVEKGIVDVCK